MPLSKAQTDAIIESLSRAHCKERLRWRILDCQKALKKLPMRWRVWLACSIVLPMVLAGVLSPHWLTAAFVLGLLTGMGGIRVWRRRVRRQLRRLEQELRQLQRDSELPCTA